MHHDRSERWHALPAEDAFAFFGTDAERGLDIFEVENRLTRFGPNVITQRKGRGPVVRFLLQVNQPLIYILIVSAIVTALFGEWLDSSVIFGIVIINACVGFIQESKALTAIAALKQALVSEATVVRAGRVERVASSNLVPGDIVVLQSGDKVPADLRLMHSRDLMIDESMLTGESQPVHKIANVLPVDAPLADRSNMAYATTLVTFGGGRGIVTATGDRTEVGLISELISTTEALATPLTRKISRFSAVLLVAILVLAGVTLVVGVVRGQALFDMFMAAVALAVGAIPEGLPAAVTIILAMGVARMAHRHTIVRRLPAVETLGSTTVICTDKTGTLTKNEMTVLEAYAGGKRYSFSGVGYSPDGEILLNGVRARAADHPALHACLTCGLMCNDAAVEMGGEGWKVRGDPTEGALIVAARKATTGEERTALRSSQPRIDSIAFESQRHYMATLHDDREGRGCVAYIKGSMERLLPRSSTMLTDDGREAPIDVAAIERVIEDMAAKGLRVLALARKILPASHRRLHESDIETGLTFLGLEAMIDPPRPEAAVAVAACRRAGIDVKMITGDHAATAKVVARMLGIVGPHGEDPHVLTSIDLQRMSDAEFIDAAIDADVFARVSPDNKYRLVEALQARGHVVAMTGDGVNDAPALRRADIGIAMGHGGTEVAREASAMVISDDNFASIEAAVEEGRGVFDNLMKFIVWTLPANLGEGLVVMAAVLLGFTLPITPVQILWINMTTAGCLGLMLAFEPLEEGAMKRRPRDPRQAILTVGMTARITIVSVLLCVGSFVLFHLAHSRGAPLNEARTVAVNVFVIGELFYLFSCRSLARSVLSIGMFSNWWVWIGAGIALTLQLAFTYAPFMNRLFHSAPLAPVTWLLIVLVGSTISIAVAADKIIARLLAKRR